MNMPNHVIKDNDFGNVDFVGISLAGIRDSIVRKNKIVLTGEDARGIVLGGAWPGNESSGNIIEQNKISGTGFVGIWVDTGLPTATFTNNLFKANNIGNLETFVDYYLSEETTENTIVGNHGDYVDEGTDNYITGVTKSGVGKVVSKAMHFRHELLHGPFPPVTTP